MNPQQRFETIYNALIEQTDMNILDRYAIQDIQVTNRTSSPFNLDEFMQPMMSIKLGKREYEMLMDNFGKYLEVMNAVDSDPQLKAMYSQFLTMMYLKR